MAEDKRLKAALDLLLEDKPDLSGVLKEDGLA